MIKKLAGLVGAGAILLAVAGPALGVWHKDVAIVKNNDVTAIATTGGVSQSNVADVAMGGGVQVSGNGDRTVVTGDAEANAKGVIIANTHIGCGPCAGGLSGKDVAVVKRNDVYAYADTGLVVQDNSAVVRMGGGVQVSGNGDRTVVTGDASARARGYVVVNTHWSGGLPF